MSIDNEKSQDLVVIVDEQILNKIMECGRLYTMAAINKDMGVLKVPVVEELRHNLTKILFDENDDRPCNILSYNIITKPDNTGVELITQHEGEMKTVLFVVA